MAADLHLPLSKDEAQVLRAILGEIPVTATWQQRVVGEDLWGRLGHLLAPTRAKVRRADRPREHGHHALY